MIPAEVLERVLSEAVKNGADWAEVFAEDKSSTEMALDDGRVDQIVSGRIRGAGIRVVKGNTTGFAHSSDLSEPALLEAARAASSAARSSAGQSSVSNINVQGERPALHGPGISTVSKSKKVELLEMANDAARSAVPKSIRQVMANYGDSNRKVLIANTDGLFELDERVRTRFNISVVAGNSEGMQTGFESIGLTLGFELFDRYNVAELAISAAQRAERKLTAQNAPSGEVPIVIAAGGGGVLFHEACGHGLEADLVMRDASVYANRIGDMVASELVTVIDDGTYEGEWGTSVLDDEGHPAQKNVLIQDGRLTDYMWDFVRARKKSHHFTGNGRRETYDVLPMVRMTNTYLGNGTEDPEEIIRQTPYGVYITKLGGGQVNTTTGDFVFGMTEAYLIEDGRVTAPLRDANLIGNGPKVLRDIDVMGNDFAMGSPGTCGKDGQGVPVGVGQPTLRVKSMTVGGVSNG